MRLICVIAKIWRGLAVATDKETRAFQLVSDAMPNFKDVPDQRLLEWVVQGGTDTRLGDNEYTLLCVFELLSRYLQFLRLNKSAFFAQAKLVQQREKSMNAFILRLTEEDQFVVDGNLSDFFKEIYEALLLTKARDNLKKLEEEKKKRKAQGKPFSVSHQLSFLVPITANTKFLKAWEKFPKKRDRELAKFGDPDKIKELFNEILASKEFAKVNDEDKAHRTETAANAKKLGDDSEDRVLMCVKAFFSKVEGYSVLNNQKIWLDHDGFGNPKSFEVDIVVVKIKGDVRIIVGVVETKSRASDIKGQHTTFAELQPGSSIMMGDSLQEAEEYVYSGNYHTVIASTLGVLEDYIHPSPQSVPKVLLNMGRLMDSHNIDKLDGELLRRIFAEEKHVDDGNTPVAWLANHFRHTIVNRHALFTEMNGKLFCLDEYPDALQGLITPQ